MYPNTIQTTTYQYKQSNLHRLHERIDQLFVDYSKILAIRLDLFIKSECPQQNNNVYMTEAIARLRDNMRRNSMFDHLIGYVWKLEYGIDREWHLHILLLFNGQCVQQDLHLSMQIGYYWNDVITHGSGAFHSCNMKQHQYKFNGIGMVEYHDVDKRNHLKMASSYLTKMETPIHGCVDAAGKAIRSFGMSQYQPKNVNAGRPRKYYEF